MFLNEGGRKGLIKKAAPSTSLMVAVGVVLLLVSSFAGEGWIGSQGFPSDIPSLRPLLLVIFGFESFSCLTCLDSFLDFHLQLSDSGHDRWLWGVLVFDEDLEIKHGPEFIQILEKKLNGFKRGNRLRFPILIDRDHLFSGLAKEGSAVLVFDPSNKVMRKYVFPLQSDQIQDILRLMVE